MYSSGDLKNKFKPFIVTWYYQWYFGHTNMKNQDLFLISHIFLRYELIYLQLFGTETNAR